MLRGVLRAKRAVGLLQRYHVKDVQYDYIRPHFTTPSTSACICLRRYSIEPPPSSSAPIRWEVEDNTATPTVASSPSVEPFEPLDRGVHFALGFVASKETELMFQTAVCDGENSQVIDGIEKHGLEIRDHFGCTPLHWAAACGQVEIVRLLLTLGADVNARNLQLCTPLFAAAHNGCVKCIQLLIEKGASTHLKDFSGHTALHYAAWHGTAVAVEELVKSYKMDLHATSNILRTPLHYAVVQQDTTSALITLGAKLDASDQDGITPLHFAASQGGVAVKELRKAGAKMEEVDKEKKLDGYTPIYHAAHLGHAQALRDLCQCGANVNYVALDGTTPLMHAAQMNLIECMEVLVEFGAKLEDKSTAGDTALTYAINNNCVEAVRFLLEQGCKTDVPRGDGYLPLNIALYSENSGAIIRALVNGGAPVDGTETARPIHTAAFLGKIEDMEELVRLGANLNSRNAVGETPLFIAVGAGNAEAALWLMRRGANVHETNMIRATALHMAQTAECVELLVKAGAKLNSIDSCATTPLHRAALRSNVEVMEKLVALGADVNLVSEGKQVGTPLQMAAHSSKEPKEIINALIKMGADMNMPNADKLTPIFYAASVEALDALVDAGVDVNGKRYGYGPLLSAVHRKREDVVRAMLLKGANVNDAGPNGLTPLIGSLPNSHLASLLLEHGADVEALTSLKSTALHLASMGIDDVAFLPKLVPRAGVDVTNVAGVTPLLVAANRNNREIVGKLLEMGADLERALAKAHELKMTTGVKELEYWKEKINTK